MDTNGVKKARFEHVVSQDLRNRLDALFKISFRFARVCVIADWRLEHSNRQLYEQGNVALSKCMAERHRSSQRSTHRIFHLHRVIGRTKEYQPDRIHAWVKNNTMCLQLHLPTADDGQGVSQFCWN